MAETEDEFCRRVANRIVSEIRDIGWSSPEDVATLRDRIGELEAENARLKIECLNGANHLEGIDTSGPGRKRMQSARMWIYQARQLAGEREG